MFLNFTESLMQTGSGRSDDIWLFYLMIAWVNAKQEEDAGTLPQTTASEFFVHIVCPHLAFRDQHGFLMEKNT